MLSDVDRPALVKTKKFVPGPALFNAMCQPFVPLELLPAIPLQPIGNASGFSHRDKLNEFPRGGRTVLLLLTHARLAFGPAGEPVNRRAPGPMRPAPQDALVKSRAEPNVLPSSEIWPAPSSNPQYPFRPGTDRPIFRKRKKRLPTFVTTLTKRELALLWYKSWETRVQGTEVCKFDDSSRTHWAAPGHEITMFVVWLVTVSWGISAPAAKKLAPQKKQRPTTNNNREFICYQSESDPGFWQVNPLIWI